jgi:GH43 family beta-xylosidase
MDLYERDRIPLPKNFLPQHPFDNGEMTIRDELLSPWPRTAADIRKQLHEYYAVISGLDHHIGRLFNTLDRLGLTANTIVIFSADQGIAIGSHGLLGKQSLYDAAMKVPLIFAGPGVRSGRSDAMVYLLDIYPTVCDLVSVPLPTGIDGVSFKTAMKGQPHGPRRELFFAYRHLQRAIRDSRWKLIRYPQVNVTQLFDLQDDPDEIHNLAGDAAQSRRIDQMLTRLKELQQQFGDDLPLTVQNPKPATWVPPTGSKLEDLKRPATAKRAEARPVSATSSAKTYRNPIIDRLGPADPAVIRWQGRYYLYPTTDCKGYDVFVSDDLVHWEQKPKCFTDRRGGAWAPDVFHNTRGDGKLYLYYTVDKPGGGKLIGVAVGDHPLGPFADRRALADNAIDAHLFQDDDGTLWLYYADLAGGFKIRVQPMADPLTPKGRPAVVIAPTEPWERRFGAVTEGPWMLKHSGVYYLMYSGSGANGPDYAIGYATARSPAGPFTKYAGNPIAKRGGGVFGPGHHCVVAGPDGRLWMVYHQKHGEKTGWARFLGIDPLWFDDQGVIHVKTTRGTDEPAP